MSVLDRLAVVLLVGFLCATVQTRAQEAATETAPRDGSLLTEFLRHRDGATSELRRHYHVVSPGGQPLGRLTHVQQLIADTADRDLYLYVSDGDDSLVVEQVSSYEKQRVETTIRTIKGDAWLKASWIQPLAGTTRSEVLEQGRHYFSSQLWDLVRVEVEITTNGGSWTLDEKVRGFELAARLRPAIRFDLLEMIERAADSLFATELTPIARAALVNRVIYRPPCEGYEAAARHALPDCAFDKRFGFPCSDEQLKRAARALAAEQPSLY
jgi:hypothetical protein